MSECIINCPYCGEKMKIVFDNSGEPHCFLLDEIKISQEELFQKYKIEFGVVESEVKK